MITIKLIYKKLSYYMPFIIIAFIINFTFAIIETLLFSKNPGNEGFSIGIITETQYLQGNWISMIIGALAVSFGVTHKSETKYVLSVGATKSINQIANISIGIIVGTIFAFIIVLSDLTARLIFYGNNASSNILTVIMNNSQWLKLLRYFFVYIFIFNALYYFTLTTRLLYKIHPIAIAPNAIAAGGLVAAFFLLISKDNIDGFKYFIFSYKGVLVLCSIIIFLYATAYILSERLRPIAR